MGKTGLKIEGLMGTLEGFKKVLRVSGEFGSFEGYHYFTLGLDELCMHSSSAVMYVRVESSG